MKYSLLFTLLMVSLLSFSCEEDNLSTNLLNYDTENLSAPLIAPGEYQMAARFPVNELEEFQGRFLEEVQVYFENRPARAEIIIYGEGTNSTPGPVLYSEVVTADMRSNQWNTHMLSTPVEIQDEELWLAIMVRHRDPIGTVGCDAGPAASNGDLFLDDNGNWTTLRTFTNNAIDINWNIRGVLSE